MRASVALAFLVACAQYASAQSAPSADSVTPSSGTGSAQAFTFQYSNGGFGGLSAAYVRINGTLSAVGGCNPYYVTAANALYLYDDAGAVGTGPITPGTAGSLS